MLEESCRRIYPVIRDTNSIVIGGSSGWNIQNSSGTLKFNYNSTTEASLSSAGILVMVYHHWIYCQMFLYHHPQQIKYYNITVQIGLILQYPQEHQL